MASLTPLSNHFSSTSKILTLSKVMLWSGWSQCTCLDTSKFTQLGLLCSMNLDFRDLPVSPMYDSSDVIHQTYHPLLDHLVFQLHQYLSKCIRGLKVHLQPISFHHSSHLLGYSFHIWNHNRGSLRGFVQDRGLDCSALCRSSRPCLIQCWVRGFSSTRSSAGWSSGRMSAPSSNHHG